MDRETARSIAYDISHRIPPDGFAGAKEHQDHPLFSNVGVARIRIHLDKKLSLALKNACTENMTVDAIIYDAARRALETIQANDRLQEVDEILDYEIDRAFRMLSNFEQGIIRPQQPPWLGD